MKCQYNTGLNRPLVYDNPALGKELVELHRETKPYNSCDEEATEAMGVENQWRVCAKHAKHSLFNRLRKRFILRDDKLFCMTCGTEVHPERRFMCAKCEKVYQQGYQERKRGTLSNNQNDKRKLERELAERYR